MTRAFIDTNVILYLFSDDEGKQARARDVLDGEGVISVQVLNEIASVCRRKMGLNWAETVEIIDTLKSVCKVVSLDLALHEKGLELAQNHGFSVYDSMIWAAAIANGCPILFSEDMQHGQEIKGTRLINPFLGRD